jgi:hypothetical protein
MAERSSIVEEMGIIPAYLLTLSYLSYLHTVPNGRMIVYDEEKGRCKER